MQKCYYDRFIETGLGGVPQTQRKVSLTIKFKVVFESSLQAVPHKIYHGLEMIRYNTNFLAIYS